MFRLLSKQTNIFSVPAYLVCLLVFIIAPNLLDFNALELIPSIIAFIGISLGYTLFNAIGLTRNTHLPLFIYTTIIFCFYFGNISLPLSIGILTSHFLLLIFTNNNERIRKNSFFLIGMLLGITFAFMPQIWPILVFTIIHIIVTSDRIFLNFFQLFFGIFLIFLNYLGVKYFLNAPIHFQEFIPFISPHINKKITSLYILIPIIIFVGYCVSDHFIHYNEKSPISRFKYTLLLTYSSMMLCVVIFYMGNNYEYMILLALPFSIIISRGLRFMQKYWMQEVYLGVFIILLLIFKLDYYLHFTDSIYSTFQKIL